MIRINKGVGPSSLAAKGNEITSRHIQEYEASPAAYQSGQAKFDFPDDYNSSEVKDTLRNRQHNKCCFSEVKFTLDYGDVEHFRPKGAIDAYPSGTGPRLFPGYYWLAYDWENLYLCKEQINTSFKRNFFPLVAGSPRNLLHSDTHTEEPLLVDPGVDDPRDHIRFHEDEPYGTTERGTTTIKLLNLRQSQLEEARRTQMFVLRQTRQAAEHLLAIGLPSYSYLLHGMIEFLRSAMQPHSEFSSMAIDFLSTWPPLTSDPRTPQIQPATLTP